MDELEVRDRLQYLVGIDYPDGLEFKPANEIGLPIFDLGMPLRLENGWRLLLFRWLNHVDRHGIPQYLPNVWLEVSKGRFTCHLTVQPWSQWPFGRLTICIPLSLAALQEVEPLRWHTWE